MVILNDQLSRTYLLRTSIIKIRPPKRTTGLTSRRFVTFTVWPNQMKEYSKLRFGYLKYVDNSSGNLPFFFHSDTTSDFHKFDKYCSSQVTRFWHTFSNLHLHYYILHLSDLSPFNMCSAYSVFLNYSVLKSS